LRYPRIDGGRLLAAAAARAGGIERAWHRAAGWLRATLADDRGAALRADLDRLVLQAIIPERASKAVKIDAPARADLVKEAQAAMTTEWDTFKKAWSK
jgi:hypothetical protein